MTNDEKNRCIAHAKIYTRNDDNVAVDTGAVVEKSDYPKGYWVEARVWVSEEEFATEPNWGLIEDE